MKIISLYKSVFITALIIIGTVFVSAATANATIAIDCTVRIEKVAKPGGDTEFDFTAESLHAKVFEFTLTSPDDPVETLDLFRDDPITVTEEVPEGWELQGISCQTNGGVAISTVENGRGFECLEPEGLATCRFENVNPDLAAIPTLSNWGIFAVALVLALAGLYYIKRKSAVKTI